MRQSIPVDLLNPGQVFACLGFLEAANSLAGEAMGGFSWCEAEGRFEIETPGEVDPVRRVLEFLDNARVSMLLPPGSPCVLGSWAEKVETSVTPGIAFPMPHLDTPAKLPALLDDGAQRIVIDHWGDEARRETAKFWTGMGGAPGALIVQHCLEAARDEGILDHAEDPFSMSSIRVGGRRMRFDWRSDYIPVEIGFSLNAHGKAMTTRGYPLVEVLAAIGLTHARPAHITRLLFSYGVAGIENGQLHDPIFLRAALGMRKPVVPGQAFRLFRVVCGEPQGPNRARSINQVTEERTQ